MTFSLLPDCLAARLPGTLDELEHVVAVAERAPSLEAAANSLRLDIELPGAMRWLRRRMRLVQRCLLILIGLLPGQLAGCAAQVTAVRERFRHDAVLMALRVAADRQLPQLPSPLGLQAPAIDRGDPTSAYQQPMGPDPPAEQP